MGTFKGCQEHDSWKGETIVLATSTGPLTDVYVDYINIYRTEKYDKVGLTYRYAVTYGRSGNYGNESNPIKSTIGTPAQVGDGLERHPHLDSRLGIYGCRKAPDTGPDRRNWRVGRYRQGVL